MEVQVVCSDKCKRIVEDILKRYKIKSCSEALYSIVEEGFDMPPGSVTVYFKQGDAWAVEQFFKDMERLHHNIDKNHVPCKTDKGYELISFEHVIRFETNGGITFCIAGHNSYEVNGKFYELEMEYCSKGFVRVSRHCMVNIKHIKEIIPWFGSKLLLQMTDGKEIDVTRGYVQQFKEYIGLR